MIALAAVHRGPKAALRALAPELGEYAWAPTTGNLASWLRRRGIRGVVRGTSEIAPGSNPETALARAAARLRLPVFAVEDFPGNFQDYGAHSLAGLFVEFESTRRFHRRRGLRAPIFVTGNPRYAGAAPRKFRPARSRPVVLWLGQPDERVCEGTLRHLAPAVASVGGVLVRRRHPRVAGPQPDAAGQIARADLVATAFSSLAVEASFQGTPALFALLPGLGADYLYTRTGARELPWTRAGAAFRAASPSQLPAALRESLEPSARAEAHRRFERLYARNRDAARRIARIIQEEIA